MLLIVYTFSPVSPVKFVLSNQPIWVFAMASANTDN